MRTRTDGIRGVTVLSCEGTMFQGGGAEDLDEAFALTRLAYLDSAGIGAVVSCSKKAAAAAFFA